MEVFCSKKKKKKNSDDNINTHIFAGKSYNHHIILYLLKMVLLPHHLDHHLWHPKIEFPLFHAAASGASGESPAALRWHRKRDFPAVVAPHQRDPRAAWAAQAVSRAGTGSRAADEGQRGEAAEESGDHCAAEEAGRPARVNSQRRAKPQARRREDTGPRGRAKD